VICVKNGCRNPAEFCVQFNDPWDYFHVCREHFAEEVLQEFDQYTGESHSGELPHAFIITKLKKAA
jgi:hypothetical protein